MLKMRIFLFYEKYVLVLNLMPATHHKSWDEATKDWNFV